MTLDEGKIGSVYKVDKILLEDRISRRLEVLGLNEKTNVKVLNRKSNGALVVRIRGSRLAIGKEIAGGIEVYEQAN